MFKTAEDAAGGGLGDACPRTEVAIIGAGPYGLTIAAHLRAAGVEHRIFGQPMRFWREMPPKMFLKSPNGATNIHAPGGEILFPEYLAERGLDPAGVTPIAEFARYGLEMQAALVPGLETAEVTDVRRRGTEFLVTTEAGRVLAKNVIVAVGLKHFMRLPEALRGLDAAFVSHTSEHSGLERFAGRRVAVLGAGQSALQTAALLHEAGARVELFVRGEKIHFSTRMKERRSVWDRLRWPDSGLGLGVKNWAIEKFPGAVWYLPERWRVAFVQKHLGPSVAWWLKERVTGKFPIRFRMHLQGAELANGALKLRFEDRLAGEPVEIRCDHLMAGTGFEIDLERLKFLAPELRAGIERCQGAPRLNRCFGSSVPGLYFVGSVSAMQFGPLFRFVVGARHTARVLARHLAGQRAPAWTRKAADRQLAGLREADA